MGISYSHMADDNFRTATSFDDRIDEITREALERIQEKRELIEEIEALRREIEKLKEEIYLLPDLWW